MGLRFRRQGARNGLKSPFWAFSRYESRARFLLSSGLQVRVLPGAQDTFSIYLCLSRPSDDLFAPADSKQAPTPMTPWGTAPR